MKRDDQIKVQVAEFKARLSEYLSRVRAGQSLTIVSRDLPVARVVSYQGKKEKLNVRKPVRSAKSLKLSPPLRIKVDSLAALIEERQKGR